MPGLPGAALAGRTSTDSQPADLQLRTFSAQRGLDKYAGHARHLAVETLTVGTLTT